MEWTEEQLVEMGFTESFDRAMFLSGCDKHRIHLSDVDGFVVTEENLRKFAKLIIADFIQNKGI